MFGFLHVLYETLWGAYFNGRKPDLTIREFALTPATLTPGRFDETGRARLPRGAGCPNAAVSIIHSLNGGGAG
jgi:hypothetical protein